MKVEALKLAFNTIHEPGAVVEVRAFGELSRYNKKAWEGYAAGLVTGYFNNAEDFAQWCSDLDNTGKPEAVYMTLNPCRRALLARANNVLRGGKKDTPTAKDEDILSRRWLLLDFDPVRPAGISSTDEEKAAAFTLAGKVRDWLADNGWPSPVEADSGNGAHLLFRINLPNEEPARSLVENVLKALDQQFSTKSAKVDTSLFNASRITKVYGTMARKGDNLPEERPHRASSLLSVPDDLQVVTIEQLEAVARMYQAPVKTSPAAPSSPSGRRWTTEQLIEEYLRKAPAGGRNNAGFDLACQIRDEGYTESETEAALLSYQSRVSDPGTYTESEARGSVRQAFKRSPREPRIPSADSVDVYTNGFGPTPDGGLAIGGIVPAGDDETRKQAALLFAEPTDQGNAEAFAVWYGDQFLRTPSHGWLMWTGSHWSDKSAEPVLELKIVHVLKERRKAAVDAEREAIVKSSTTSNSRVRATKERAAALLHAHIDDFDNHPDLLNCKNGVVNLRTGEISPHDPAQRFTYCVDTGYDASADSSLWREFLASVLPDPQVRQYLQTALGYTLTGSTREEVLFYLYGPTRSGKSTLSETLLHLLGRPIAHTTDFGTFTAERNVDSQNFALAPLKAARLVVASESGGGEYLNVGKVKQMTGGDYITAAHKHRDSFVFKPTWKVWLLSNHGPKGDVDDDALWRARLRVIEFPNSFLGNEDKTLKARLQSPENRAGVLAWLVEGARRWYAGGLATPPTVEAATARHRAELDHVSQWLDECDPFEYDPALGKYGLAFLSNADMRSSYEEWCRDNGVQPKGARSFGRALSAKGYIPERNEKGKRGMRPPVLEISTQSNELGL